MPDKVLRGIDCILPERSGHIYARWDEFPVSRDGARSEIAVPSDQWMRVSFFDALTKFAQGLRNVVRADRKSGLCNRAYRLTLCHVDKPARFIRARFSGPLTAQLSSVRESPLADFLRSQSALREGYIRVE
jgi:hypothetical protein